MNSFLIMNFFIHGNNKTTKYIFTNEKVKIKGKTNKEKNEKNRKRKSKGKTEQKGRATQKIQRESLEIDRPA